MTKPTTRSNANVQVANAYIFNGRAVSAVAHAGSFEVNAAILDAAVPRQRVGTTEVLSDEPSAVVAGVERGAASAATNIPSAVLVAGRIVPAATVVGGGNGRGQRPKNSARSTRCESAWRARTHRVPWPAGQGR